MAQGAVAIAKEKLLAGLRVAGHGFWRLRRERPQVRDDFPRLRFREIARGHQRPGNSLIDRAKYLRVASSVIPKATRQVGSTASAVRLHPVAESAISPKLRRPLLNCFWISSKRIRCLLCLRECRVTRE